MAATTYFNRFSSYCKMVAHAKNLARKSVLIDHCGVEHIDLKSDLKNVDHVYSIEKENRRGISKLSLIEFKTHEDADRLVSQAGHNEGLLPVPLKILRYNGRVSRNIAKESFPFTVEDIRLTCQRELSPQYNDYTGLMANNMMSLVALKLRFITLVNFEKILCSGPFEDYELMPFGSSVIDMGCESGDLDLVITRKEDHCKSILNSVTFLRQPGTHSESSKFVHLDKSLYSETRDLSGFRGAMKWFDHVLKEYMPLTDGFGVQSIYRAKVPIIKFTSRITNIDCDLSFNLGLDHRDKESSFQVLPGILMTEILYSICRNNNLIVALTIYLRIYARMNCITSKVPGVGMTNFQFMSLILFFLQRTSMPSSQLNRHASDTDGSQIRHEINIVPAQSNDLAPMVPAFKDMMTEDYFVKTHTPIQYSDTELNLILPNLIGHFFDFYSRFDFGRYALNLHDGKLERKRDNCSLYVVNPIETNRNICHNVNRKAIDLFVKQIRLSLNTIRSTNDCPLTLLKDLMVKHNTQAKRTRTFDEFNDTFSPQSIAEDVCR